jgi:hypothetical protein
MDRERELAFRAQLRELHVQPPDHLINAMLELGDELPSDGTELLAVLDLLGFPQGAGPGGFGGPESFVRSPIGPRPSLNAGRIVIPEPEERR